MRKERLTLEDARNIIKKNLKIDSLSTLGARAILEGVIPFSWHNYCKENNFNPNMLMDKHERSIKGDKSE